MAGKLREVAKERESGSISKTAWKCKKPPANLKELKQTASECKREAAGKWKR